MILFKVVCASQYPIFLELPEESGVEISANEDIEFDCTRLFFNENCCCSALIMSQKDIFIYVFVFLFHDYGWA